MQKNMRQACGRRFPTSLATNARTFFQPVHRILRRSATGLAKIVPLASSATVLAMSIGGCSTISQSYEVQAYKVQAPFDSFVCFDSTFDACIRSAQAGSVAELHSRSNRGVFGQDFLLSDPNNGKSIVTSDRKYKCDYGYIPYTQKIDGAAQAMAVFVSPTLLSQIGEAFIKVGRIRDSCNRLVQAYNFQLGILILQDQQATSQLAVQYLSARVENENLGKAKVGTTALTAAEQKQYGLPAGTVADSLKVARNAGTRISEQLRNKYKAQTLEVDYRKQFTDAQVLIDSQLRELGRELFVLDRATVQADGDKRAAHAYYKNGAWVQQGTVVMSIDQRSGT